MTEGVMKGYRLSPPQQRLWRLQGATSSGGRTPYWSQAVVRLSGGPERRRMEEAVRRLVQRHELLRTGFAALPGMGLPLQVIAEQGEAPVVSWHEVEGRSLGRAREVLEGVLAEAREQEVEWERGVGLQVAVVGPVGRGREWWVGLSLPALYGDGRGLSNVGRELGSCYGAGGGEEGAGAAAVVQYADLSEWQNELLEAEETQAGKWYWAGQDRGGEAEAQWERWSKEYGSGGRVASEAGSEAGSEEWRPARVRVRLSGVERGSLATAAREVGVGVREWLLGCWALLWSRLSSQSRLVIATRFDGRNYEELKDALGFFERYLPIRLHLYDGMSFKELLKQVAELTNDAYQWQECFTWEQLAPSIRDVTDVPFWPIGFEFREPSEQLRVADLTWTVEEHYSCTERFHLKLACEGEAGGGVRRLWLEYDSARFESGEVKELAENLRTLLAASGRAPKQAVSRLALLSERQRRRLVEGVSRGPRVEVGESVGVQELFAQQVAQGPDRVAVVCGSEAVSYGELNVRAERLAARLRQLGVGAESRVGLLLERSVGMVVGLLGVLKAGGAYVPMEVGYPDERVRYVVEDAGLAVVVTEASEVERVRSLGAAPVLCGERVETSAAEAEGESGAARSGIDVSGGVSRQNLCYVIYTSGSTGRPKGVMVTHGQLLNYVSVARMRLGLREGMSYGLLTTFAADLGHTVTFPALCTGGCLHVVATEVGLEARRLSGYLREQEIECLKMVPSQLAALVRTGERVLPQTHLVLGGEALTEGLVERVKEQAAEGTELVLYNHYGPTETTVGAVAGRVWQAGESSGDARGGQVAVGLGRAMGNTSVYVVDGSGEVAPQEVAGEVYIGGAGVARGYLQRPELTAERFIPDEFSAEAGARLYRTGDLARYRADGELEFLGRIDNQVKIRGYRIELGEIEAALCAVSGVRAAVVVARADAQGEQRLVGYVVLAAGPAGVDQRVRLRRELGARLPDYMVPAVLVELEQLPLTANGKVDRRALPEPERMKGSGQGSEQARTPVEELLSGIWAEVLGVEGVGVEDNFFELGGHSLLATQVVSRVRETCGVELALRELFAAPSVRALAVVVEAARRAGAGVTAPPLVAVSRDGELPLSFAQQRLWFLDQLEPHNPFYNIPAVVHLAGALDQQAMAAAFSALVRRHEALRTAFAAPEGRPQQVIAAPADFTLEVEDLSEVDAEERLARATELAAAEAQRPFELAAGGLLRVKLWRLSAEEHVLALVMHHIVSDGWSMGVLVRELVALYGASRAGREHGLERLAVQYADFAVWQREWLSGAVLEGQLSYWRKQLAGAPALLELPTDYPRPAVQSHRGAAVPFAVPLEQTAGLKELSRRSGVTLFMTLLAAFEVLLLHYTGQTDLVVGTNIANRNRAETENLIGFFINQLVLRVNHSGNPTFAELLERVREVTLEAYAHQDLPFERLVEELQPERDRSRALLYQAKLEIQSVAASPPVEEISGLKIRFISIPNKVARYDLYLSLADSAQGMQGSMLYNADLFKPDTITRMLDNLKTLLSAVIERPTVHLDELTQLLTAKDRQRQELIEKEIENAGLQMLRNIQRRAISQVDV